MLTDTHCRNAKPKEKLYRLNDQRGLYLEVKPNGVKAWRYRFTLDGKATSQAGRGAGGGAFSTAGGAGCWTGANSVTS